MIIQPYVENSIKHGIMGIKSGGIITISFEKKIQALEITVEDNGVGMVGGEQGRPDRYSGNAIIKERIDLMRRIYGKSIHVSWGENEGPGTKVSIWLPEKLMSY